MISLWNVIHQYAYFWSLVLFVLPFSAGFDAALRFHVARRLLTLRGMAFIAISIAFWSAFDMLWIHALGSFPADRVIATIWGVPLEEMLLFVLAFYNIGSIFAWAKHYAP